jgi:hypothetical protein
MEEPYPYNLPPWRRQYEAVSPDGCWRASIAEAREIGMSDPTAGELRINDKFVIPRCSPAFIWSDDSRFLAVPQWKYWLRRRQRLLIIDVVANTIVASRAIYRLLVPDSFRGGVLTATDSPIWKPKQVRISCVEAARAFKRIEEK